MPFCPQCGFEYEEDVTTCPDCSKALAPKQPKHPGKTTAGWPPPEATEEEMVVIYEAPDQSRSEGVKQALDAANIPVLEEIDRSTSFPGIDLSEEGRYSRILTLKSYASPAIKVVEEYLAAYERGDFALPETPEDAGGSEAT